MCTTIKASKWENQDSHSLCPQNLVLSPGLHQWTRNSPHSFVNRVHTGPVSHKVLLHALTLPTLTAVLWGWTRSLYELSCGAGKEFLQAGSGWEGDPVTSRGKKGLLLKHLVHEGCCQPLPAALTYLFILTHPPARWVARLPFYSQGN